MPQCIYTTNSSQCNNLTIDPSGYCSTHKRTRKGVKKERNYLLNNPVLNSSIQRQDTLNELKSLREEIMLARALVETRLNLAETDAELVASMPLIQSYIVTIEKLVSTCQRMEVSIGELLSKASLLTIAQEIVSVLNETLDTLPNKEEIVDQVSIKLIPILNRKQNEH